MKKKIIKSVCLIILALNGISDIQAQNLNTLKRVNTNENSYAIEKIAGEGRFPLQIVNAKNKFTNIKPTRSGYAKDDTHILPSVIFDIKIKDLGNVLRSSLSQKRWEELGDDSLYINCYVNDSGRVVDIVFNLTPNTKFTAQDIEKIENTFKTQFQAKITHPEFKGTFNYLTFGYDFKAKEMLSTH